MFTVDEQDLTALLNAIARLEDRAKVTPFFNVILSDPDAVTLRQAAHNLRKTVIEKHPDTVAPLCGKIVVNLGDQSKAPCKLQAGHSNGCNPF